MTESLRTKLDAITQALRHTLDISEKATPKWDFGDENNQCADMCMGEDGAITASFDRCDRYKGDYAISREEMLANVKLCIHARTMLPATARALLVAIEGLFRIRDECESCRAEYEEEWSKAKEEGRNEDRLSAADIAGESKAQCRAITSLLQKIADEWPA